jgi:hypothetical protein
MNADELAALKLLLAYVMAHDFETGTFLTSLLASVTALETRVTATEAADAASATAATALQLRVYALEHP